MARILELVCPSSVCTGFGDVENAAASDIVVACDSDWMQVRSRWISEKGNEEGLIVLPVPIGDPWAYWEFSIRTIDKLHFDEDVQMSQGDFSNFIVNDMQRGQFDEDGNLQLYHDSYLSLQDDFRNQYAAQLADVERCLSDDASRALLKLLHSGSPQGIWGHYLSSVFGSVQYFDFIDYSQCRSVLNGGIWLGFELPLLFASLPDDAVVHNVDPYGHDHLSTYVYPTVRQNRKRCIEHRVALSDHTGTVNLTKMPDGQANATIADSQIESATDEAIECTTIDDFVHKNALPHLDLIKFDLEGSDIAAVRGMQETVRRFRPQLAISIYHHKEDYWKIPLTLTEMCVDYRFHLGHYSYERFETIFYCIPNELTQA
jgi:FkbM family methyltransferase